MCGFCIVKGTYYTVFSLNYDAKSTGKINVSCMYHFSFIIWTLIFSILAVNINKRGY
jgi:hypothetical protein